MEKSWKDDWKNSPGHPGKYYDLTIQPIEYFASRYKDALAANVIKYTIRHAKKNGKEDLEKARWYVDWMERSLGARAFNSKEFLEYNEFDSEVGDIVNLLEAFDALVNWNEAAARGILKMIDNRLVGLIKEFYE